MVIFSDVQTEVIVPSEIPDWLKERIWQNEQALLEELLALGEGDTEIAIDLSNRIVKRNEYRNRTIRLARNYTRR